MRPTIFYRRLKPWQAIAVIVCCAACFSGCQRNPYLSQTASPLWQQPTVATFDAQVAELQRRVQHLDDNNRQLHTQLAQAEQQSQLYRNELDVARQQLAATARDLETTRLAATESQQRLQAAQVQPPRGSATLAANTTLKRMAEGLTLGTLPVEPEGDVLRIRIPADQLFQPGTAQMLPGAATLLDPIAASIPQRFARQRIGIEGHCDDRPTYGGAFASPHQLTAAQSVAVFDYLTRRANLPQQQFFTIAQGANYPRVTNESAAGRATNRRMEVVIYPETF